MAKKTRTEVTNKLSAIQAKTYEDTIAGKIESIEDNAQLISYEVSYLGLGDELNLANSAAAVAGIINQGTIAANIKEGESYTLTAGYYEGGTVTGVSGGGNYTLTTATATPTEALQTITAPTGYYGLSQVSINPIPTKYKDTTGTNNTTAADVLAGKFVVTTAGKIEGTMTNRGAVTATLLTNNTSYEVPEGYHNGNGVIQVGAMTKTVTPTEAKQTIYGDGNKYLSSVTVEAIDKTTYLSSWTIDANATASDILHGQTAYVDGEKVEGTMANQAAWDTASHVLTTTTTSVAIPQGYHNGTGTVSISTQSKTAAALTPGMAKQTITPDTGKLLSSVVVPALDSKYQDVSSVTAMAAHVCVGYKFVNASGTVIDGTLADGGNIVNNNFYNDLLSSGADGCVVLSGTEAHYTSVNAAIDGSLYTRLAAI